MSLMLEAARSILTEAQAAKILKEAPAPTLVKAFDNLRSIIGAPVPADTPDAPVATVVDELLAREEIILASFDGEYAKRSVAALAKLSGLSEDEVLDFVEDSDNLFTQKGRRTGKTYVLLHDGVGLSEEQVATVKRAFSEGSWSQRTVRALANLAGVSEAAILALIDDNDDFAVSEGRRSGRTLVEYVGRPVTDSLCDDEPECDDYDDEDDEWLDD
jgi:hypothetical protein